LARHGIKRTKAQMKVIGDQALFRLVDHKIWWRCSGKEFGL